MRYLHLNPQKGKETRVYHLAPVRTHPELTANAHHPFFPSSMAAHERSESLHSFATDHISSLFLVHEVYPFKTPLPCPSIESS
jgi:hypothetical protein